MAILGATQPAIALNGHAAPANGTENENNSKDDVIKSQQETIDLLVDTLASKDEIILKMLNTEQALRAALLTTQHGGAAKMLATPTSRTESDDAAMFRSRH